MEHILKISKNVYSFFRLLSFDIVLGAISGAYFASNVLHVHPSVVFWIVLCSTVWIIYTLDHILDGFRTRDLQSYDSYVFHYKWRRILIPICTVLVALNAIMAICCLEREVLVFGSYTLIFVAIYVFFNYLLRNRQKLFLKEIIISGLYTWGIFGGMIALQEKTLLSDILVVINYFLLVLSNVLIYSYFDFQKDKKGNFITFALNFGREKTRSLIFFVCALAALLTVYIGLRQKELLIFIVFAIMNVALFVIIFNSRYFEKNKLYGILADAVFFTPAIPFLFL